MLRAGGGDTRPRSPHGSARARKTTLAHIIAAEMGVKIRITSGPVLDKPGDLAGLLTNLEEGDVLFIDEIHRLNPWWRNTLLRDGRLPA